MKLRQRRFLMLIWILAIWLISQMPQTCYSQGSGLIITQVGLSQTQGTTFLTMILSHLEQPQIQPVADRQKPQLLIDFPKAKVGSVPAVQAGDQKLVKQVRTTTMPGGSGVRIIVDFMPGQPYSFWRSGRANPKGGYQFLVGIKPDRGSETPAASLPATPGEPPRTYSAEPEPPAEERPASGESSRYSSSSEYQRPTSGELAEIARLMPAAGPLLGFLQQEGWSVQKDSSSRGGSSQKFLLASSRYPNLSISMEHLPTKAAGSTAINIVALSTDKMQDSDADKYRQMLRWDMAKIKSHYEDIGDYYDDGLKPLRLRLRERSKAIVLRDFEFYQKFLEAAVPQQRDLPEKIKKHVQDKPNKRLEGAQFTESENPLVIMDLVDFYTLRIYYVGR